MKSKDGKGVWNALSIFGSCVIIFTLSYAFDLLVHHISPDVCVLGVANALFTLIFYFIATRSFLHLAETQKHYHLTPRTRQLLIQNRWLIYPLSAILLLLPLNYFVVKDLLDNGEGRNMTNLDHVKILAFYGSGALLGILIRWLFSYRTELANHWPMVSVSTKWLVFVVTFAAFGFQLAGLFTFNFSMSEEPILRYAASFAIMIMGFHMLYFITRREQKTH
ncbi:hypothetical protein [Mucilaginibacter lacusdianchii]|uniref:hypothetical protein n=1 Tax=Mucilaginibacter lacusdianchii TaxID=2684211 RepID=UPI00131E8F39|nr:hypothetical protein [Mucilaginibacter sp. JXJ CY 39]